MILPIFNRYCLQFFPELTRPRFVFLLFFINDFSKRHTFSYLLVWSVCVHRYISLIIQCNQCLVKHVNHDITPFYIIEFECSDFYIYNCRNRYYRSPYILFYDFKLFSLFHLQLEELKRNLLLQCSVVPRKLVSSWP